MKNLWWALVAFSLAGCAAGPNYKRPDLGAPTDWRFGAPGGASLANLKWWDLFKDPGLEKLTREALAGNWDLEMAAAKVDQYRGLYGVANSNLYPKVNATAGATRQKYSGQSAMPYPATPFSDAQVGGSISWDLDLSGKLRRAREAANADVNSMEEARRAVEMSLVSEVATSYFTLLELDTELRVDEKAIQVREDGLRLTAQLLKNGVSSAVAVEQAKAELESAKRARADVVRQMGQQEDAISFLLGKNPGAVARNERLEAEVIPIDVPVGLPSELLERRPDIREAEQGLVAANARVGEAKAAFFPQISLTASGGTEAGALSNLFSPASAIWSLGGNITAPIFRAGEIQGSYDAAKAVKRQALAQYAKTVQQAFKEVNDALIAHRQYREMRAAAENEVQAANKGLELASVSFKQGIDDYLSVLTAQRQVFEAETNLAQINRLQLATVVELYRALGGGWEPPKATP